VTRPAEAGAAARSNTFVGMPGFPQAAKVALLNTQLRRNLAHATSVIRAKRNDVVGELDDWQELRRSARRSRTRCCVTSTTTWRSSTRQRPRRAHGCTGCATASRPTGSSRAGASCRRDEVVKVKSMATQEMGMNDALADEGIAALETDLAELIVQLNDDLPSHILVPAIHLNRAEIPRDLPP
jgi:L-lactate dehydrogenase complex protein LldF